MNNRILAFVVLSLAALWFHDRGPPSIKTASDAFAHSLRKWGQKSDDGRSSVQPRAGPDDDIDSTRTERRSLLRMANASESNENRESRSIPLNQQMWYNPIQETPLREGIIKGLHNIGIFLLGWFVFMCTVGGIMRCYLCCQTMQGGDYSLLSLYNSFVDRDPATFDDAEGIALDTLGSRDNGEGHIA